MRNILYTRRKYEKINPGAFDKTAVVLIKSEAENALGEKVATYTEAESLMVLFDKLNSSIEDIDELGTNKFMYDKGVLITWMNSNLLNSQNRVKIEGDEYNILDGAEAFARNRFVRCLVARAK